MALVSIWTLSPGKLETAPAWRGDGHLIGLQLKVHGRKRNGRTGERVGMASFYRRDARGFRVLLIRYNISSRRVLRRVRRRPVNRRLMEKSIWQTVVGIYKLPTPTPVSGAWQRPRRHALFYCVSAASLHLYLRPKSFWRALRRALGALQHYSGSLWEQMEPPAAGGGGGLTWEGTLLINHAAFPH